MKNRKIVVIDPGKSNLIECFNGEKKGILRYTQNLRRNASKRTRYKQIRRMLEEEHSSKCDETVQQRMIQLSETKSRSIDFKTFMEYVNAKSKFLFDMSKLYHQEIFRRLRKNAKINLRRTEDLFLQHFRAKYGHPDDVVVIFGDWRESKGKNTY